MILTWKVKDIKGIWTFNKEPYNRMTTGKFGKKRGLYGHIENEERI